MEPILLKNIISQKELFFMYNQWVSSPTWQVTGVSSTKPEYFKTQFNASPLLNIYRDNQVLSYPNYIWAKTVVYRIESMLEKQNKSIPTTIRRAHLNITYTNNNQHFLHIDKAAETTSVVLFLTPVWFPDGEGAFYVEGKKFDFVPGGAVIFRSSGYHKGEPPSQKTKVTNWLRLTCNMILEEN